MAIDFPNSPSVNDTYVADERTWKWDGTTWRLLSGIPALAGIDITNAVDINADIVDADDIPIYDVSASANRKMDASRIPTYVFGKVSGDLTITSGGVASIAANSVALGTDTTGNYVADVVAGTGVTVTHTPGEGSSASIAIGQAVGTTSEVTFSSVKTTSVIEPITISATAATGTIAVDVANGTTYYTSNAAANFVINLRWNSSTTLDSKLATGEMATTSFMVTNGATPYYATSIQINGTTSGVTTEWQGSTGAPTSGNANSVDMYTMTAVKTGAATFTVFAAQTRFA
jgi:hypothetical protein